MKRLTTYKIAFVLILCCTFVVLQMRSGQAVSTPTIAMATAPADVQLPPPVISPNIPDAVFIAPGVHGPVNARPFFDYFSWQSFVAINWPAALGTDGKPVRGEPNTASGISIGSPGARVWETYKADWELFTNNGATPTPWESYDLPEGSFSPCGNPGNSKLLVMISKMDSVVDGINQAMSGPLVDQNRNYVRYDIHVNKAYFNKVADPNVQWYLYNKQSRDPNRPNEFPDGVIEVKAAWKELVDGKDDASSFYTVNALIVQPGPKPTCRPAKMGLIGLHIANKVKGLREWVWSTFEHVNTVPEGAPVPGQKYSLNNGLGNPPPAPKGFDRQPAKIKDSQNLPPINSPERNPIQVNRITPISTPDQMGPTTDQINAQWQQALAGTIWQNYKLIVTQWPTVDDGKNFKVSGTPPTGGGGKYPTNADDPFPKDFAANLTMETYLQKNTNCMKCHYLASQDDFSYMLMRAYKPPPPLPVNLTTEAREKRTSDARVRNNPTMQALEQALAENDRKNRQATQPNRRRRQRQR
jgi:hypothetical protein